MVDPKPNDFDEPEADRRQRESAAEVVVITKRVTKIAWAIFAVLLVVTAVFWFVRVRAPDPATICNHKVELVFETVGSEQREGAEALVDKLEVSCVEAAERKIQLRGKLVYADYAKCVMAANSLADAERC